MVPARLTNIAVVVVGEPRVFVSLVAIALIAVLAPIIVDLRPSLRIPAVVVEMVLGCAVGPFGFNLISPNVATNVLSFLGLGYLLFVAGLELNPIQIRRHARSVVADYAMSAVLGIGAGPATDGQVLVFHDLLGIYDGHAPRFAKHYADVRSVMVAGVAEYAAEVRSRAFPGPEYTYSIDDEELERFREGLESDV